MLCFPGCGLSGVAAAFSAFRILISRIAVIGNWRPTEQGASVPTQHCSLNQKRGNSLLPAGSALSASGRLSCRPDSFPQTRAYTGNTAQPAGSFHQEQRRNTPPKIDSRSKQELLAHRTLPMDSPVRPLADLRTLFIDTDMRRLPELVERLCLRESSLSPRTSRGIGGGKTHSHPSCALLLWADSTQQDLGGGLQSCECGCPLLGEGWSAGQVERRPNSSERHTAR